MLLVEAERVARSSPRCRGPASATPRATRSRRCRRSRRRPVAGRRSASRMSSIAIVQYASSVDAPPLHERLAAARRRRRPPSSPSGRSTGSTSRRGCPVEPALQRAVVDASRGGGCRATGSGRSCVVAGRAAWSSVVLLELVDAARRARRATFSPVKPSFSSATSPGCRRAEAVDRHRVVGPPVPAERRRGLDRERRARRAAAPTPGSRRPAPRRGPSTASTRRATATSSAASRSAASRHTDTSLPVPIEHDVGLAVGVLQHVRAAWRRRRGGRRCRRAPAPSGARARGRWRRRRRWRCGARPRSRWRRRVGSRAGTAWRAATRAARSAGASGRPRRARPSRASTTNTTCASLIAAMRTAGRM